MTSAAVAPGDLVNSLSKIFSKISCPLERLLHAEGDCGISVDMSSSLYLILGTSTVEPVCSMAIKPSCISTGISCELNNLRTNSLRGFT